VLLLFLGTVDANGKRAEELGQIFNGLPSDVIDIYRIARGLTSIAAELRDVSGLAHTVYGLLEGGVVLVRPDGYIGYRSNDFDPLRLKAYLGRLFLRHP